MVIDDQNVAIEPTDPLELTQGHLMVDVLLPEVGSFLFFSVQWDYMVLVAFHTKLYGPAGTLMPKI